MSDLKAAGADFLLLSDIEHVVIGNPVDDLNCRGRCLPEWGQPKSPMRGTAL